MLARAQSLGHSFAATQANSSAAPIQMISWKQGLYGAGIVGGGAVALGGLLASSPLWALGGLATAGASILGWQHENQQEQDARRRARIQRGVAIARAQQASREQPPPSSQPRSVVRVQDSAPSEDSSRYHYPSSSSSQSHNLRSQYPRERRQQRRDDEKKQSSNAIPGDVRAQYQEQARQAAEQHAANLQQRHAGHGRERHGHQVNTPAQVQEAQAARDRQQVHDRLYEQTLARLIREHEHH